MKIEGERGGAFFERLAEQVDLAQSTAKIPKLVRCGAVLYWIGSNPLLHRVPLRVSVTRCSKLHARRCETHDAKR
jgi:hypothetical protein